MWKAWKRNKERSLKLMYDCVVFNIQLTFASSTSIIIMHWKFMSCYWKRRQLLYYHNCVLWWNIKCASFFKRQVARIKLAEMSCRSIKTWKKILLQLLTVGEIRFETTSSNTVSWEISWFLKRSKCMTSLIQIPLRHHKHFFWTFN